MYECCQHYVDEIMGWVLSALFPFLSPPGGEVCSPMFSPVRIKTAWYIKRAQRLQSCSSILFAPRTSWFVVEVRINAKNTLHPHSWKTDHPWVREETKLLKHSQYFCSPLRTTDPKGPWTCLPTQAITLHQYMALERDFKWTGKEARTSTQTIKWEDFTTKLLLYPKKIFI